MSSENLNIPIKDIGMHLLALRRKAKLTQEVVAYSTGIDQSFLSKAERGKAKISDGMLKRILEFYAAEGT